MDEKSGACVSMPLGEHLEELRARIIRSLLAVVGAFVVAWFFRQKILDVLIRPHELATTAFQLDKTLKFQSYIEPLTAQLKACLIVGLIVAAPWVLYQMWGFVAPGLYRRERKLMVRLGLISALCFAVGVSFGYFLFIPLALRFLLSLSGTSTEPLLMIGSYLSLFILMTVALGIVFQTPLVIYHLVKWDIVSVEGIQKHRKGAILGGFVVAAVFTPPDPFTQMMIAIPLVMLYDLGALAAVPNRQALWNFTRFAGTVVLIGGIILGFFFLWPVGTLEVIEGDTALRGLPVGPGVSPGMRRGDMGTVFEGGLARITFGEKSRVLIEGEARLQVHGRGNVSLLSGKLLAVTNKGNPVEIRTDVVLITLRSGTAECLMEDEEAVRVNVVRGMATARSQGRDVPITGGHSRTFTRGGQPLDSPSDIERSWQEKLPAATTRGSGN